jgi:hypothetical protein
MFSHFGYEYVTRAIGRVKHLPKVAPDHPFEFFAATWLPGFVEGAPKASNESAQSFHASGLSELRFLILPSQTAMRLHQIVKPKLSSERLSAWESFVPIHSKHWSGRR